MKDLLGAGCGHCSQGFSDLRPADACPICGRVLLRMDRALGHFLKYQHQIPVRDFDARASSRIESAGPRGGCVSSFVRAFLSRRVKRDERRSRIGGAR